MNDSVTRLNVLAINNNATLSREDKLYLDFKKQYASQ